jgi:hypothetical protein
MTKPGCCAHTTTRILSALTDRITREPGLPTRLTSGEIACEGGAGRSLNTIGLAT